MILFLNRPYYHSQLSTERGNLFKKVFFTINCYTRQAKTKHENMSLSKLHSAVTKKLASC